MITTMDDMITTGEARDILKVKSYNGVKHYINNGRLKSKLTGGRHMLRRGDVVTLKKKQDAEKKLKEEKRQIGQKL